MNDWDLLKKYCCNKSVLQIGVLGDYKRYLSVNWKDWDFANIICKVSKECVGIDIDRKGINLIRQHGFKNIFYGNAENFSFPKKFDVIYAGSLIEHLSNIGLFLENCYQHLNDDGYLILSTNNPYSFNALLRGILNKVNGGIFYEHTVLLCGKHLKELSGRYHLKIVDEHYYTNIDRRSIKFILFSYIIKIVSLIFNDLNESYVCVLKKDFKKRGEK